MPDVFLKKLDELRTELVDLAVTLERRGRHEAADVALTTSARVGEIHDELRVRSGAEGDEGVIRVDGRSRAG